MKTIAAPEGCDIEFIEFYQPLTDEAINRMNEAILSIRNDVDVCDWRVSDKFVTISVQIDDKSYQWRATKKVINDAGFNISSWITRKMEREINQ